MFMLTEPNLVCCLLISFLPSQKSDAVLERHEIGLEFDFNWKGSVCIAHRYFVRSVFF
jgi:hypothetical protein